MRFKCLYHPNCRYKRAANEPCCDRTIIDVIKTAAVRTNPHQQTLTTSAPVASLIFCCTSSSPPPRPLTCLFSSPSPFPWLQSDRRRRAAGAEEARQDTPSPLPPRQGSKRISVLSALRERKERAGRPAAARRCHADGATGARQPRRLCRCHTEGAKEARCVRVVHVAAAPPEFSPSPGPRATPWPRAWCGHWLLSTINWSGGQGRKAIKVSTDTVLPWKPDYMCPLISVSGIPWCPVI